MMIATPCRCHHCASAATVTSGVLAPSSPLRALVHRSGRVGGDQLAAETSVAKLRPTMAKERDMAHEIVFTKTNGVQLLNTYRQHSTTPQIFL